MDQQKDTTQTPHAGGRGIWPPRNGSQPWENCFNPSWHKALLPIYRQHSKYKADKLAPRSMKLFLLVIVKMPTIVGILRFMSGKIAFWAYMSLKKAEFLDIFILISN